MTSDRRLRRWVTVRGKLIPISESAQRSAEGEQQGPAPPGPVHHARPARPPAVGTQRVVKSGALELRHTTTGRRTPIGVGAAAEDHGKNRGTSRPGLSSLTSGGSQPAGGVGTTGRSGQYEPKRWIAIRGRRVAIGGSAMGKGVKKQQGSSSGSSGSTPSSGKPPSVGTQTIQRGGQGGGTRKGGASTKR